MTNDAIKHLRDLACQEDVGLFPALLDEIERLRTELAEMREEVERLKAQRVMSNISIDNICAKYGGAQ